MNFYELSSRQDVLVVLCICIKESLIFQTSVTLFPRANVAACECIILRARLEFEWTNKRDRRAMPRDARSWDPLPLHVHVACGMCVYAQRQSTLRPDTHAACTCNGRSRVRWWEVPRPMIWHLWQCL